MLVNFALLLAGLVVLYYGAEFLVQGASRIALGLGIAPLIVGLTVVALGTSAPELVVSLLAALNGTSDIAIGNVVGSNIANIALIVGAASVIMPMAVDRSLLRRDYWWMLGFTIAFWLFAWLFNADAKIGRLEAGALSIAFVAYIVVCIREARKQRQKYNVTSEYVAAEAADDPALQAVAEVAKESEIVGGLVPNLLRVVGGIAGLVVGAKLMVDNAVVIAESFGVSELVIGVTIVAIGTSLPELATSLVAAFKKESDLSLGNIVGSNIFNVGFIIGSVGLIRPIDVSREAIAFDIPFNVGVTLVFFPLMFYNRKISRVDGGILLAVYAAFLIRSFLVSTGG